MWCRFAMCCYKPSAAYRARELRVRDQLPNAVRDVANMIGLGQESAPCWQSTGGGMRSPNPITTASAARAAS